MIKLSFREKNPVKVAVVALVVILGLIALALNSGNIYRSLTRGLVQERVTSNVASPGGLP